MEVCRQIKQDVTTSHIMVLQVSASCITPHDRARGLSGGADVYLTEPVESAELLGAARALLRLYNREQETRALLKERTEQERFIKNLIDAAPSLVCLYDLQEGRSVYLNAKADHILNSILEGFPLHSPNTLMEFVHSEDLPHILHDVTRLPSMKDGEVLEFEFRLQSSSKEWRWVNLRLVVFLRDPKGHPAQILAIAQDITERKHNEQARIDGEAELLRIKQQWITELEQKVSERTIELIQSRKRLRALASELTLTEQRERQRLATDLHDYLAQLLVFGRMKLGQAKRDSKNPWTGTVSEELDQILDKALTYIRSLVAELSPPVLREFGLAIALEWLAQQMTRQELSVMVNCDLGTSIVSEDQAVLLFQSTRELLINVLKHAGTPRASVSVWIKDDKLHLCVADEGVGFNHGPLEENKKASTFGLFSIRERMEDLGGQMTIASMPGQGTKVTLMVPLVNPSPGAGHRRSGNSELPGTSITQTASDLEKGKNLRPHQTSIARVLLVDDHALLRQGLRSALEEYADIEIVGEAANGEQAVALAKSLRPDIVIMDINMPVLDGIEATHQLHRQFPNIRVIGLSVDDNRQVQEMMRKAGAVSLWTKDTDIEKIHETILLVLRSHVERHSDGGCSSSRRSRNDHLKNPSQARLC
jgi:PAS domain S-box-containing protein